MFEEPQLGLHPPQQARSRAALQRILVAAEQTLATSGLDNFTMAAVAERAEVSVGALYRRFSGKEPLLNAVKDRMLTELEDNLGAALAVAGPGLAHKVTAFVKAVVEGVTAGRQVFPDLVATARRDSASALRGGRAVATMQRLFLDAAFPHINEVRRADAATALTITANTIVASCVHRTINPGSATDGLSWARWREQVTEMALLYLTAPSASE
jgi:AcrR family transcriptional regulator